MRLESLNGFSSSQSFGLTAFATIDSNFNIQNQPSSTYDSVFKDTHSNMVLDEKSYKLYKNSNITENVLTSDCRQVMKAKMNDYNNWTPEILDANIKPEQQIIEKSNSDDVSNDYMRKLNERNSLFKK